MQTSFANVFNIFDRKIRKWDLRSDTCCADPLFLLNIRCATGGNIGLCGGNR
jgi:hypothetical protein